MHIHYRMLLPTLIHSSPILVHSSRLLVHLLGFRFSATYLYTLNRHDSSREPIRIEHTRLSAANRIEHTRLSAAGQNQVLRHPSLQPIRIEHPWLSAAHQNRVLRQPGRQLTRIENHYTEENPEILG